MEKNGEKGEKRAPETDARDDDFPETETEILAAAAEGQWEPFFRDYLRPCWREVLIVCRGRNLSLDDTDDLYQELMLRLVQDGGFNRWIRLALAREDQDPSFRGNLPGRYLKYRELPVRAARFRTYIKKVIRNLVLEASRRQRRRPKQLHEADLNLLEPWIDQSITQCLDRQWVLDCLAEAAWRLQNESLAARTRGRRRLFEVLVSSAVKGQSPGKIAGDYGVDRTTASGLLKTARERYVILLQQITGIADLAELRELLAGAAEEVRAALAAVHADCPD